MCNTFCLEKPGSITKTTPSIVSEVSAIFVATTTLRPMAPFSLLQKNDQNFGMYSIQIAHLGGAGSNILC